MLIANAIHVLFVKDKNFYCLVKSSYNQEAKEIYDAQLTNCVRVIKGED